MCQNGSWNFAFRERRWIRDDVIAEQCTICDDYRKRFESDIRFIDE